MDIVLLVARLILAAVFVVAGAAKLADPEGSRQALIDFGVPRGLANPFATLLPLAELAVALALLPNATAWWGALGALVLLLLFVVGISASMARGKAPDCHCFGQLHSEPAGWSTLARNGVLALLAGFVVFGGRDDPGYSPVGWLGNLGGVGLVSLIAGVIALVLVVLLTAQYGRLLTRIERLESLLGLDAEDQAAESTDEAAAQAQPQGLPVGSPAPSFQLTSIDDETLTLEDLRAIGKPLMFIFLDPGCGPCAKLMPEIGSWQRDYQDRLSIILINRGELEPNRAVALEHGITNVLLAMKGDVPQQFHAHGTPAAVLVGVDGTIGSPVAAGPAAIRSLLDVALSAAASAPDPARTGIPTATNGAASPIPTSAPAHHGPAVSGPLPASGTGMPRAQPRAVKGELPPTVRLPDLEGKTVDLSDFLGGSVAVLFFSPTCEYSRRLLDELKGWESNPPPDAPRLLIVSAGTAEVNRNLGLRSPVVLDNSFQVGRQFGASGTPSAVLVDERGRIASDVMAGAPSVMRLLTPGDAVPAPVGNGTPRAATAPPPTPLTALQPGEIAPELSLPDLDGNAVSLSSYLGSDTLVLFWNPNCRFCQGMLDELKSWEANPPPGAPALLVVSAGSVEANRALGLRSTVVLDRGFATGRAFGTNGTPSAVMVDAGGRIASRLAVGGPAVLQLLGAKQDQVDAARR